MCPPNQFGRRPNDDTCYPCNYYSNDGNGMTSQEQKRFSFICARRVNAFKPMQSGSQSYAQNKYSLQSYRREKVQIEINLQKPQIDSDSGKDTDAGGQGKIVTEPSYVIDDE